MGRGVLPALWPQTLCMQCPRRPEEGTASQGLDTDGCSESSKCSQWLSHPSKPCFFDVNTFPYSTQPFVRHLFSFQRWPMMASLGWFVNWLQGVLGVVERSRLAGFLSNLSLDSFGVLDFLRAVFPDTQQARVAFLASPNANEIPGGAIWTAWASWSHAAKPQSQAHARSVHLVRGKVLQQLHPISPKSRN